MFCNCKQLLNSSSVSKKFWRWSLQMSAQSYRIESSSTKVGKHARNCCISSIFVAKFMASGYFKSTTIECAAAIMQNAKINEIEFISSSLFGYFFLRDEWDDWMCDWVKLKSVRHIYTIQLSYDIKCCYLFVCYVQDYVLNDIKRLDTKTMTAFQISFALIVENKRKETSKGFLVWDNKSG